MHSTTQFRHSRCPSLRPNAWRTALNRLHINRCYEHSQKTNSWNKRPLAVESRVRRCALNNTEPPLPSLCPVGAINHMGPPTTVCVHIDATNQIHATNRRYRLLLGFRWGTAGVRSHPSRTTSWARTRSSRSCFLRGT